MNDLSGSPEGGTGSDPLCSTTQVSAVRVVRRVMRRLARILLVLDTAVLLLLPLVRHCVNRRTQKSGGKAGAARRDSNQRPAASRP